MNLLKKKKSDEGENTVVTPKRKKGKKKIFIVMAIVIIIAGVTTFFFLNNKKKVENNKPNAAEATVKEMDITTNITGTATVEPKDSYSIISLVQGDVKNDYFSEGSTVKEGDVLYKIDAENIDKSIQSAEISLQKAQNSYNDALKSRNDLSIKSDITGSVTKLYVKKGDNINGGSNIAEVNDASKLKVKIPFNNDDANMIHNGDKAMVNVVGTGNEVNGVVSEVASASYVKDGHMLVRDVTIIVYNPMAITTTDKATAIIGDFACNDAGTFEYFDTRTIVSKTSGKIESLSISEGSKVSNGQTIAVLSSDSIDSSLKSAELSIKDSKISLEKIKDSKDDYEITAPISGTVVTKNVKAGDKIDNTNASTELAVIYDMSLLKFDMSVDELDINKVSVGQEVDITADAIEGKKYTGTITNVSVNGTTSNGVTTYPVTVEITDFDDDLLPGMNIDASITVASAKGVLAVPVNAVNRGNKVFVKGTKTDKTDMAPEGFKTVEVVTGTSNDDFIEITKGLKKGDIVYSVNLASAVQGQMMPGMMGGHPGGGNMGGPSGSGNNGGGNRSGGNNSSGNKGSVK